jgi:ataxin-3
MNEIERLTGIYHETQEGSLCAQHALNNLLQREYFSAVSLAAIAQQLDEQESHVLGNRGGESHNMDDSGFFSIQVLQNALKIFDIELIPYASQHAIAQQARVDPQSVQAYICNLREHWLTIRRFGTQYFDLNSISTVPKLISNTYLSLYLAQLQQSGYSIFIIHGDLLPSPADERLLNNTIDPVYYRSLTDRADAVKNDHNNSNKKSKTASGSSSSFDEREIQRALKASVELDNADDKALQDVLAQSLRDAHGTDDPDTVNKRLLDQAIAASLTSESATTIQDVTPTVEEVRQRRLQFFDNKEKPSESNE